MIVCHCRVVSDRDVAAAMDAGVRTLAGVCQSTGAGRDCGGCVFGVRSAITDYARNQPCPLHSVPDVSTAPSLVPVGLGLEADSPATISAA